MMRATLLLLALSACGAATPSAQSKAPLAGAASPPPTAAQLPGAELDCVALAQKIHTCADGFEAAYATTEDAGHRGRQTVGGEPNGPAGAKTLMVAFRLPHNRDAVGVDLCKRSWQTRDPRWTNRLAACDVSAPCEVFNACAGPAIGDPLPVPE